MNAVKKIVKYAILSHRWSDDELSFQDFGQERSLQSTGWAKIVSFCTEAARQGMCFAWIDTCCIDKTSSAELDESIRSMFKWYQSAATCIIHLDQTTTLENIAGDEWFRRGWTLQELLAPGSKKIQIFNRHWHCIASHSENDGQSSSSKALNIVSRVTGIPGHDLRRFRPSPREVDQRMTWAANREVTREEDSAYLLMGIFDVSISIAYGEGLDRAFYRLIEAIMAAGADPSVLNWG
ncbi:HET-domain-containing protein, partial [Coniophora puteana RWD-64-598 SS2]